MNPESQHNSSDTSDAPVGASTNRYMLLAVIAVAVVAAVYLLKANMEPRRTGLADSGADAVDSGSAGGGMVTDSAVMQDIMQQVAHVRTILAKDSADFDAWVALGNLFFDVHMSAEAIIHYRRALALHPGDLNVMTDLATMEREAGHPAEAVEILKRVIAVDSTHPQSWFNLGVIYSFDLQDPKSAVAAWRRFLALSPPSEHTEVIRKEIERLEKESGT
jgi:cytochrome c-type biogenesis protein CcmH/NrfG